MSQYMAINPNNGRQIIYGLDKPTGGYFWQEYFTVEELGEIDEYYDEISDESDGLPLSTLIENMKRLFSVDVDVQKLTDDFFTDIFVYNNPITQYAQNLHKIDILSMLKEVEMDVIKVMQGGLKCP